MDWPERCQRPRLAGVNSFGISGTNAHVVVEEYLDPNDTPEQAGPGSDQIPTVGQDGSAPRRTRILPLSGKSEGALRELAQRYRTWLDAGTVDPSCKDAASEARLSDMSWTAGVGRSHFDHRAGITFHDAESLRQGLTALAEGVTSRGPQRAAKVGFLYTGQGSQWSGMGQALYESEPVARAILDRCDTVMQEVRGASLLDVIFGREGAKGELGDTAWEQPALYALECALTALWASIGIRPSVVLGHSVGELAAAHAAGVFSLEDGMRFAATRGTLLSGTEHGAMAAVFAPASRVSSAVDQWNASSNGIEVSISADNGAHQVVSGPVAGVEAISDRFDSEGIRAIRLNTSWGFHSALLDRALDGLEAALDGVSIESPSITLISNLTGQPVENGMKLDGAYWRRHARQPVAFAVAYAQWPAWALIL